MTIATMPPANLFRTLPAKSEVQGVDRDGNRILGAAVMQLGSLNDSRPWDIDDATLDSLVSLGNATDKGIKARFTHPSMSSDGLGKHLGRWTNFRREGDAVRADLSFAETAFKTPSGDLATYVMDLADEDPESFGNSIAFELDDKAMKKLRSDDGRSPVRIAKLRAVDVVDEPASTRTGMFSVDDPRDIPAVVTQFLDTHFFGVSPEVIRGRLDGLLSRYFEMRGIDMPEPNITAEPETELSVETPEVPAVDVAAQLAADRKRIKAIQAVCGMAKVPTAKVNEFIDGGADLPTVNLFCASHLSTQNPPVAADAVESTEDPDATLKADYREHCAKLSKIGMKPVSEDDYIRSRKIDAGEIPLGVF